MLTKLTKWISIITLLFLFVSSGYAQIQETKSLLNDPKLKEFNDFANRNELNSKENNLLIGVLSYEAPYEGYFQVLTVSKNGQIADFRNMPGWAIQNYHGIKLNAETCIEFLDLLKNLKGQEQSVYLEPKHQEVHTAFIYLQNNEYKRIDYVGDIPFNVQQIISLAHEKLAQDNTLRLKRPPRKS